ncbi:MAG TPA: cell wall-binding repeat-containing protein [candidate division Zixibacteria bacterium]|nr:cell wall-binding repeat-containing protein [candidate division Zixibacteria bacterium]
MRDRLRTFLASSLALALAWGALGVSPATAAGAKVVIIVGPTGAQTDSYRQAGDQIAASAQAAGANVVKVYSPRATWPKVKAAVEGANIIVYLGHGNGFPNPYGSSELPDRHNGWGLNRTEDNGDQDNWSTTMVYCGEKALLGTLTPSDGVHQWNWCGGKDNTDGINPAPGFVMIYNRACYTPGAGESWDAKASESVALQRVRNYSAPALKLGASAYFATDINAAALVETILENPTMPYWQVAESAPGYSASAQRQFDHPDVTGAQIWIQRTSALGSMDYWYAYAGKPWVSFANPDAPFNSRLTAERYAGPDRFATAAAVSAATFPNPGVPVAYVATGSDFPDALAGSAAAAHRGGPVLLVTSGVVPSATAQELSRLKPQQIVVLGGTGVISQAVAEDLAKYATTGTVRRLAGADRYETAAAISRDTFPAGVPVAYVATGANFPDALAGTPPAGSQGGPVLLVTKYTVPAATAQELARLKPQRIAILGATAVVSSAVADELESFTAGAVERLAGADRYATAVEVSEDAFWDGADTVFVATGLNFPDALAGGPVAGMEGAPLLLVPGSSVPAVVKEELLRLDPDKVVVLGSTGVVSSGVVTQMKLLFPAE